MECPSCQYENPDAHRFCGGCGTALPVICPACGFATDTGTRFCGGCGNDLSGEALSQDPPQAEGTPRSTGERRQASVLFSDLSGYTAMNEKMDPEEVEGIMSRVKAEAVRIVEEEGGIVSQFVGDEVLALFGIPTAHEDDPRRAVQAALKLHELVRGISPEVEERIGGPLRLHTGINTGLVVTSTRDIRDGTIGVTGDTVNAAARLVSRADVDEIILGAATRRQVAPFFDLEELEPVTLKGKGRPMVPYRVLGISGVTTRFEAAEARGFTPYTGRNRELSQLKRCLDDTLKGEGQFVTLMGEAGLGKSRLFHEFRRQIDHDAMTVLQGRCQSVGQATPYLPFTNALRRGLNLRDEDTPDELHAKAVANLRAIDPALEEYIPVYLHLLSIPTNEHPLPDHLSGEKLRNASQDALAAAMLANSKTKPMVLMLEDWHWADEASDTALRHLLEMIDPHALLVMVNYRPEYELGWGGANRHLHITMPPLSANHSEIVAKSVLGAHSLPEGLGELVHQRTGGNPFFIEEMCLDLLEEGTVLVKDGQAALTRAPEKLDLPATVQAVIRSRLDRLNDELREVLRLASVIGREFDHVLLSQTHQAASGREDDTAPLLKSLVSQNLIQQVRVLPESAYQFKHVLTQVVVYETMLLERRRDLHGVVGRTMEELYADRLEEQYETLAYQYQLANEPEKAIEFLALAGDKAARNFALVQARNYYHDAFDLQDGLEKTKEHNLQRIDLTLKWATVSHYAPSTEHTEVLAVSQQYAREIGDRRRLANLIYWSGRNFYVLGLMGTKAMAAFTECVGLAEALEDEEMLGRATNFIGFSCFHTAEYAKGIAYLDKGIAIMERLGDPVEVVYANTLLAAIYGWIGDFKKSGELLDTVIETSKSMANPTREATGMMFLGTVKALQGEWKEAIAISKSGADQAEILGITAVAYLARSVQGYATAMNGDRDTGIKLLERVEKLFETSGMTGLTLMKSWHAEALALDRKGNGASEIVQQVTGLKEISGQHSGEAVTHRTVAMVAVQESPPDWDRAEDYMLQSLRFAEEYQARPDLAIGEFRYAELLNMKGELESALQHLDKAATLFGEMEMAWWSGQAEGLRGRLKRGDSFKGFAPYVD